MNTKSKGTALLLWILTGGIAGHKFYLKESTGKCLLFILTGGGFGVWWLLDFFRLSGKVDIYNLRLGTGNSHNNNVNTNNVVVNVSKD